MTPPSLLLARLRDTAPLVQCITNYVAMNITANVLLAAGASPAMVHATEEAGEFAALAGATLINIGTLSADWREGMHRAAESARAHGKPWVLDPVAHQATTFRRATVAGLLALHPTLIRGNASEIIALGGGSSQGQGVDSGDPVEHAAALARAVARQHGAVVAVTGAVDYVSDGTRAAWVAGGSPLMPRVTALGCALSALCAAFAAVAPREPFAATVAALALFGAAGRIAHEAAAGPGSFAVAFLDALPGVNGAALDALVTYENASLAAPDQP
ncbi:hydroxyethylthiazole kinase [Pararhodospirillum oryzae]|uniref:Hydroxyethylthiazole kinase n=1 Tax=Pararhodospirillum oryzae TaxID=478448 RepID=A0A512H5Y9_9PROT|nr:hydroxyethylthiazole kinase [Pararhodospirillum oryzae]GEO80800.1 hydroxyethylthiazole kinase [Pararhodospirillum oryzae]